MRPPLNKYRISGMFGMRTHPVTGQKKFHNGVDLAAPEGSLIYAPLNGTVIDVWEDKTFGGGLSIRIQHDNNIITGYAHLKTQLVKKGQRVEEGEIIATVGNTGKSTGAHLHFTVTKKGVKVDPILIFKL